MAQESRGSNGLGWAVLGFLAGVAATLGVLTFMSPGHRHREEPAGATAPIAPPAPKIARSTASKAAAKTTSQTVSSAAAAATTTDQQVQEDAAAAGMTSRRQSSEPPPN
jgi:hypothetical protein